MDTVPTPDAEVKVYFNPWKQFQGAFLPNWLMERRELSFGEKVCYARLCQYAGRKGTAYPSHETLGKALGIARRQAQRLVEGLISCGLIESRQQGKKRTNRYFFLVHPWMSDASDLTHHLVRSDASIVRESQEENQGEEDYTANANFAKQLKAFYRSLPAGISHTIKAPGPYFRDLESKGDLPPPFDVSRLEWVVCHLQDAEYSVYPKGTELNMALPPVPDLPGLCEVWYPLAQAPLRGKALRSRMRRFAGEVHEDYTADTILGVIARHPKEFIRVLSQDET